MSILVVGLNHKTAPVELREQFAFSSDEVERVLASLTSHSSLREAVILSTCNRVEIYTFGVSESVVTQWLCEWCRGGSLVSQDDFLQHGYVFQGIEAVEHLMQVACGLDSLVVGEPEIFGQVKAAFAKACLHKTVGAHLSRLFRQTFQVAKRVRTSTKIGACPVSVASTAVLYAKERMSENPRVLIIGTGQVGGLVAKHAKTLSSRPLMIVSRNFENAKRLANEVCGIAGSLEQLTEYLSQADIVISSTSSQRPIISLETVENISHKILLIDLAVPRDVAPDVAKHPCVTLCQLDQLKAAIQQHVHMRAHAAMQAELLIEESARDFILSLRTMNADEIITQYRTVMEAHCDIELQKALKANQHGEATELVLKDFSRKLINKMMHLPCVQLRQASVDGRQDFILLASELLGVQKGIKL
jgi:glutamyl-tRNA reductase